MTYETHVHYIPADGADTVARFDNSRDAWTFMRLCSSHGLSVGYPTPTLWDCVACRGYRVD